MDIYIRIYKDIWGTHRYNVTSCNINIINVYQCNIMFPCCHSETGVLIMTCWNKCGALTSSEVEERNGTGARVARILQGLGLLQSHLFNYFCHQIAGASHLHVSHVSFVLFSNCSASSNGNLPSYTPTSIRYFHLGPPIVEAEKRQHSCPIMSDHALSCPIYKWNDHIP